MIYKYWYVDTKAVLCFTGVKTDVIDFGSLRFKKDFLMKKIAYEAAKLKRTLLRFETVKR